MSAAKSKLLVVEDDRVIRREIVSRINDDPEMTVVGSYGLLSAAQHAVATLEANAMLLDLELPDGNGIELIPAARRRGIDVLILTVSEDRNHVYEAIAAGACGYLLKADALRSVVEALRVLRQGGSPISPIIARRLLEDLGRQTQPSVPESTVSEREWEIVELFSKGATYSEVAAALGVSINTIRSHVRSLYDKLSVSSKAEAVVEAMRRRPKSH